MFVGNRCQSCQERPLCVVIGVMLWKVTLFDYITQYVYFYELGPRMIRLSSCGSLAVPRSLVAQVNWVVDI